ncbi:MAG: hypothetical protein ACLRRT_09110 [Ruthenibacterium lactatiformans]
MGLFSSVINFIVIIVFNKISKRVSEVASGNGTDKTKDKNQREYGAHFYRSDLCDPDPVLR